MPIIAVDIDIAEYLDGLTPNDIVNHLSKLDTEKLNYIAQKIGFCNEILNALSRELALFGVEQFLHAFVYEIYKFGDAYSKTIRHQVNQYLQNRSEAMPIKEIQNNSWVRIDKRLPKEFEKVLLFCEPYNRG